ncbi:MAG TPA: acyltransferase [Ramlibacter sp.]|uniref:acyltransferase family protein n=1 Tax=Ramlibacter sp. TaxID=1917967 RepID=UPI002C0111DF|nr:acyltransferase [Ramlibacter sp.]HVZ46874.1 acyltransferase [Ramlibacter sp.]
MTPAHPRRSLPALTSLRFIAASGVLLFHLAVGHDLAALPLPLRGWLQAGYLGVTFFFVLSGFVLYYVYCPEREDAAPQTRLRDFALARAARLAPAYYLALAIALPFVWTQVNAGAVSSHAAASALVLTPALLQAWYPPASMVWNAPAWSLSVEAFFYAAMLPLAAWSARHSRRAMFALAAALLAASVAIVHVLPHAFDMTSADGQKFIGYFPPFHLASFVTGMATARWFIFGPRQAASTHTALFFASAAAVLALLGWRDAIAWWHWLYWALVPLFALVVYGAASLEGPAARVLEHPWLVLLGDASYALYILHVPLLMWAFGGMPIAPATGVAAAAAIVGLSVLTYRFLETPLRRRIARL